MPVHILSLSSVASLICKVRIFLEASRPERENGLALSWLLSTKLLALQLLSELYQTCHDFFKKSACYQDRQRGL